MALEDDLVSIVIPLFNAEESIRICINSVLRQTYDNIEIIIVDDFSSDNGRLIAEQYLSDLACKYRILQHDSNRGVSEARNTGIKASAGKYIFFLDSDDVIAPDCIEHLVKASVEEAYDIVYSDCISITKYPSDFPKKDYGCDDVSEKKHSDILKQHGYVCGCLYTKDVIAKETMRFTGIYMEDVLFNARYLLTCKKIGFVHSAEYYYYIKQGSLSRPGNREIVAERNLDCAYLFDFLFLTDSNIRYAEEIVRDRRYIRNCYFGELSCIGFKQYWKQRRSVNQKTKLKTNKCFLRQYIIKAKSSFAFTVSELIMSFDILEWLVYFVILGIRK